MAEEQRYESIRIERGKLGTLLEMEEEIQVRPLTVFIGEQGTAKSLVSQLLYFFRNLPYLVQYYEVKLGRVAAEQLVRAAMDDLRSDRRAIAVFADPSALLSYYPADPTETPLKVRLYEKNRQVKPHQGLKDKIARVRRGEIPVRLRGQALFVPAERILYSHARGPSVWKLLSLPSTLVLFADALEYAGDTFRRWPKGVPDTPQGQWIRTQGRQALKGEAERSRDEWYWRFGWRRPPRNVPGGAPRLGITRDTRRARGKRIDMDMASSGQKANWPLVILAEALFSWRQEGVIEEPFYLHIEEPEIHLHPAAQVKMVELLAYLVNQGFNVTVTTHSPTVLYALNNLLVASDLGDRVEPGLPDPAVRLPRGRAGAYFFRPAGTVKSIVDKDTQLLSESDLAEVDEALEVQLNRLEYLRTRDAGEGQ